jgi:CheY-like chemotaxis protein
MMPADSSPADEKNAGASRSTIVLLDDDATTLMVLHTILEQTDADIIECEDEPCAVSWCERQNRIDLLVADVVLQGSNGPAVVRRIRPSQPLMRLLYISGFSLTELHRRGLLSPTEISDGSVEFLQKPFSPEEFRRRVAKLLMN